MFGSRGFNIKQIKTPCPLRAGIYKEQLRSVHDEFHRLASNADYTYAKTALKDRHLLVKLAEILDEYVMVGVAADLGRCRTAAHNLYGDAPPLPRDVSFLRIDGFESPSNDDRRRSRKEQVQGYQRYFKWYIACPRVLQKDWPGSDTLERDGIEAFYLRYPMILHAIERITEHFRTNIQTACQRVRADLNDIGAIFFNGSQPRELVKIESTGSDFHKGGKQVLILTFKLGGRTSRKLVYKPSDVEMDYRLVGNTDGIRTDAARYHLGNSNSLTELLNNHLHDDYKPSTYRILPRNPGSGLLPNADGSLLIQDSYGYIEFLTHEPEAREDGAPKQWRRGRPTDWVAENAAVVHKFYRQWGCILAMASVFSLSDLHQDNLIVHELQPHPIDLEVCFTGPVENIQGTLAYGGLTDDTIPSSRRWRVDDRTANLVVDDRMADHSHSPAKNRLWFARPRQMPAQADPEVYIDDLCNGLMEALQAFRGQNAVFRTWLGTSRVQQAVARFIPYATGEFNRRLRLLYSPGYCHAQVPDPAIHMTFDREPFNTWRTDAGAAWYALNQAPPGDPPPQEPRGWPRPRPNYAIQTIAHNFTDYLNCDVPAYYHRLDSLDLLNARGNPVVIDAVVPNPNPDPSRDTYFQNQTHDIVSGQLAGLAGPQFSVRVDAIRADLQRRFNTRQAEIAVIVHT
jgi:hypothetical protein